MITEYNINVLQCEDIVIGERYKGTECGHGSLN